MSSQIIHKSPLPEVEIPNVSIGEYILREADRVPDRLALVDGPSGRSYTYGQLKGMIHALPVVWQLAVWAKATPSR